MLESVPLWLLTLFLSVLGYELLRFVVVRRIKSRLHEGAVRFVRRHRVHLESARFIDRVWLREALLQDPEIDQAVAKAAEQEGTPQLVLRDRIEIWVNEITPAFSLTAYYRLGAFVARAAVRFCYELVFDKKAYEKAMATVPADAVVVFVINHRSNADYILLAHGLIRHIALSYAVGEWARVWPLDLLFRAFGSYFVRRGEKDRLYHKVLERYVQLLVGNGGVTGFFIEGKLSRDGRLGAAKAGLLDAIIGVRRTHPNKPIWFVPIGLNLDRVFEDRTLLAEDRGRGAPRLLDKLRTAGAVVAKLPAVLGANLVRVATRSHRKFGNAAIAVGQPVALSELVTGGELATLPFEERWPVVKQLAGVLLDRVGAAVPATPVPVFCYALLLAEEPTERAVPRAVRTVLAALRVLKVPVLFGAAFEQGAVGNDAMPGLDEEIEAVAEAEMVVMLGAELLGRRNLVRRRGGWFQWAPADEAVLRYYAASLAHHLEGTPYALPAPGAQASKAPSGEPAT